LVALPVSAIITVSAESRSTFGVSARVKTKLPTIGNLMKTITKGLFKNIPIIVALAGLLATRINTFAIEGLHVSVQCSNVVLSWPSADGETYIVQYRQTLAPSDSWQTLIDNLPNTSGTNVTAYIHSNVVQNPCNCGGSSFAAMGSSQNTLASAAVEPVVPMAIPTNGVVGGCSSRTLSARF
jgi:hypothetical protein